MSGGPVVYPNYSYEYLQTHPEARVAAKLDFIKSLDNTRAGYEWERGIQRAQAQEQQIRPRRSKFVEVTDERQIERNPNSRALTVPLKDGRPDFSERGYLSTLQEQEKTYGNSVSGGGRVETAASFMAEGQDGTQDVARRTHYRTTTTGQDFYLTEYRDKSYEIRTRSGQIVASGSEWNAYALEDAQYRLSGDFLWDVKNRPLDYKPPVLENQKIRIIDDGRGPVQIDSTHPGTKEAYKKALLAGFGGTGGGSVESAAAFMGEGLSRDAAVQSRSVYLSQIPSNNPGETVYRRLYMTNYGDQGAELRTAGGQIVLSSGSNDPAVIEQALESKPVGASIGARVYEITPPTEPVKDTKNPFDGATPAVRMNDASGSTQDADLITQKVSESLGFLQGLDKALPDAPDALKIGLAVSTFAGPSGAPMFIADMISGQQRYNLEYAAADEMVSHPADTFAGGAILGGYALYEMGKAAVTDPVGSVIGLPQSVPAAIVDTGIALQSRPLQTITSLYVGGKMLSVPGKGLAKGRAAEVTTFKPEPMPEFTMIEAHEGFHPFSGGYPTMEKAWTPPRTVTIADEILTRQTKARTVPEVMFNEPNKAVFQADITTGGKITKGNEIAVSTKPVSVEFDISPAISRTVIRDRPSGTVADGTKIPVLDLSTETTHTSSIPHVRESGYVIEEYEMTHAGRVEKSARFIQDNIPQTIESEITLRDYMNDPAVIEAQRFNRYANHELVREFGADILKAEHLHYGPLELVRDESPMMPEDWGRLITSRNLPIREHIKAEHPEMLDIINMEYAQKVGKYEERVPTTARSYDVPYMSLEFLRNPSSLHNLLTGEVKTTYTPSIARKARKSNPLNQGFSEQNAAMKQLFDEHPKEGAKQAQIFSPVKEAKPQDIPREKIHVIEQEQPTTAKPSAALKNTGISLAGTTAAMRAAQFRPVKVSQIPGEISITRTTQAIRNTQRQGAAGQQVSIPRMSTRTGNILRMDVTPAVKEAQRSKRDKKILILERSASDVMQNQRQSMDSIARQIQRPKTKTPTKQKPKRATGKPSKKGSSGAAPEGLFEQISGNLDIRVVNPRVKLKDLRI